METTVNKFNGNVTNPLKKHVIILFVNRLITILAYYHVKSASHSLLIEYRGAIRFPRVWIASALVPGTFIGSYKRLVECHNRFAVVPGSCLLFIALLSCALILVFAHWLILFICSAWVISSGLPAREYRTFVNRHPAPA